MREYQEYERILELWERGVAKRRIALTLGIPRATVRDCIERYKSLEGLEEQKMRASRSSPAQILNLVRDSGNIMAQQAYAYLLGMYLGDGYIVRNNRIFYLRIALDSHYPNIIQRCVESLQTILLNNKVNVLHYKSGNWVEVVCTYKFWPELFPQHGIGPKHERKIALEDWQRTIVDTHPLDSSEGFIIRMARGQGTLSTGRTIPVIFSRTHRPTSERYSAGAATCCG